MNIITQDINYNNTISWLEKYRPMTLSEYYISKQQLDIVKKWIKDFRNNVKDAKPFLILYGSPGIGKTTLAYLILEFYNYEIIECNASDVRTKKTIRETIGQISKTSVCIDDANNFKKIAIIMDEIDGLFGGESSSVQEIVDIITKDKDSKKNISICPVICTSNSIKDKKLQPLIKNGIILNINKPSILFCKKIIDKISKKENFKVPNTIKNDIINKSHSDYRQIIILLFEYNYNLKLSYEKSELLKIDANKIDANKIDANKIENKIENKLKLKNKLSKELSLIKNDSELYNNDNNNNNINFYDEDNDHFDIIKKISKICETPLDKINYFLTNKTHFDDISYTCSYDSNLYYMNLYINIIPILNEIQLKSIINNKDFNNTNNLEYYKFLYKIFNLLKTADLLNNSIFLDKNWDLLDFFDALGFTLPLQLLYNKNILDNKNYNIHNFSLSHHTQYNFMRQEQSIIKKKLNLDYIKTQNIDLFNIYYNIKRFMNKNDYNINITKSRTKKKKSISSTEENKYHIDKLYIKIIDKINELLS
jgi:DNA polymerase III delta prime subunit